MPLDREHCRPPVALTPRLPCSHAAYERSRVQDFLASCFKLRMPESAIALWTREDGEAWADSNDRLILKLLDSSEVGLGHITWTNHERIVRKIDGAPQSGRISKCAHPRPIRLRSSHASLPCITLLQESSLVRLQRRQDGVPHPRGGSNCIRHRPRQGGRRVEWRDLLPVVRYGCTWPR